MTREYRETVERRVYLGVSKVTCDRCGERARVIGAPGGEVAWGTVKALVQGEDAHHADLCRDCTEELRGWIDSHPGGRGMASGVERGRELDAAEPAEDR